VALFFTVIVMGAFQFPLMALFLASAMDLVPREVQGTTTSLVFGSSFVFSSVAPGIAGVIADEFGVRAVFFYAAAIVVVAGTLLAVKGKR
jgi:MFS family permease